MNGIELSVCLSLQLISTRFKNHGSNFTVDV
jgi:hypothetical protein